MRSIGEAKSDPNLGTKAVNLLLREPLESELPPEFFRYSFYQAIEELMPIAVILPAFSLRIPVVVICSHPGSKPDLMVARLAVQDELAAIGELEAQEAISAREIEFVGVEILEPGGDPLDARVGEFLKSAAIHVCEDNSSGTGASPGGADSAS